MCTLPLYLQVVILISSSVPLVLLSRFIINLRQIDSPGTDTSANQHQSRFSVLNLRMPTMDDVVGNLGEPLDFDVEHRLDDEDDVQDGGADADLNAELRDASAPKTSRSIGVMDFEAEPSGSGSADADADVLGIDGILEEVCLINARAWRRDDLLESYQLRYSPNSSV